LRRTAKVGELVGGQAIRATDRRPGARERQVTRVAHYHDLDRADLDLEE
jgi:hypothetical protein